jgi:small subunit ribosomal protein S21
VLRGTYTNGTGNTCSLCVQHGYVQSRIACMTTVKVRPGDSIDKALRALKKRLDKEGIMKAVKAHRFYAKPSVKKRVKSKAASKYRRTKA